MKIAINEVFGPTIQGEGRYAGTPSVFIRTNGCNLRCCFAGGSRCDTPYTSHCPEKSKMCDTDILAHEIGALIDKIGGDPENSHIVITGGEPMLQQEGVLELLGLLHEADMYNQVTIETNGTIMPSDDFYRYGVYWSVSPKLSNSCCFEGSDVPEQLQTQHIKTRINIPVLASIVCSGDDYQFKFVYSDESTVTEIKELLSKIREYIETEMPKSGIANRDAVWRLNDMERHVMLMPEGMTIDQLNKSTPGAVQACIDNGWIFSDRTHIRVWNDKRGV